MELLKSNGVAEAGDVDSRKAWLDLVDVAKDQAAEKILQKMKWEADKFANREPTKKEVQKVGKYVGQKAFPKFVRALNNVDVKQVILASKKSKPLFLKTV